MERSWYVRLAESGLAMPIGTDLVLREQPDPETVLTDGEALGRVFLEAAARYGTPLALPTMDLELEKCHLLGLLGIAEDRARTYHFAGSPGEGAVETVRRTAGSRLGAHMAAMTGAISHVAAHSDLVPVGMCIGPFSLMTKLVSDPIVPIAMAGAGVTAEEDDEIRAVEQALEMAIAVALQYIDAQIRAGARAIFVAEPAANKVYLSPNQIEDGSDIFDRYVMKYNRRIRALLAAWDVDLLFHCCGELTDYMVDRFASLDPAILSLGSSRGLVEDAALVANDIVLFGNLPSKRFYSDTEITPDEVREMSLDLLARMRATGHPFILGSECDVLSVPGCEAVISGKVAAMMECGAARVGV
jgi:hypothetical protein